MRPQPTDQRRIDRGTVTYHSCPIPDALDRYLPVVDALAFLVMLASVLAVGIALYLVLASPAPAAPSPSVPHRTSTHLSGRQ